MLFSTARYWSNISIRRCSTRPLLASLEVADTPRKLVYLGESIAGHSDGIDFAGLNEIVLQSRATLGDFGPNELVGLLTLVSRIDFVDSDFSESIQQHLPARLRDFADNHWPIIFTSVLRLGIDQPIDRVPSSGSEDNGSIRQQSSPLMKALIDEIIPRVPRISESGCLAILHSIVRRPKLKITQEMEDLVSAICANGNISQWGLSMRIQAIHTLSRLGVTDNQMIRSLFENINSESVQRIASGNLQHLLSIIHNHADNHEEKVWRPVLDLCVSRLSEPVVARSMPMATIAVSIGYMGRLNVRNERVLNFLLMIFSGIKPKKLTAVSDENFSKLVTRVLTDSQIDIGHLGSILEALERLQAWHLPYSVPLALLTRRLILRDGIHNVKAAPICLTTNVFLRNTFGVSDKDVTTTDTLIDTTIAAVVESDKLSSNWSLKSTTELVPGENMDWRQRTNLTFLEGLLKHEQYIRSTASSIERCVGLGAFIKANPRKAGLNWNKDVPEHVRKFIDSLTPLTVG